MKKTIRPILRDDLSRKGLEKRIDLRVYLDGRQTKFATPYSIAPACWDKKSGRVVGNCPEKSVINSYLNGKETEYERYLFQCEMLGETVDLERIREILTGKARTAPSEKTNATLDEIFDAYVDKLRTDNRCERTIIGILDLKKDMAKFSKRSKKRTIDQLDILFFGTGRYAEPGHAGITGLQAGRIFILPDQFVGITQSEFTAALCRSVGNIFHPDR